MHFEILVEDQSGKKMLDILLPKIIGEGHTFKIIDHQGVGHIPRDLTAKGDPNKRLLLNRLPAMLRAYGKTFVTIPAAVIVVCDLDDRCMKVFREELFAVLDHCDPKPETRFCFALEEGEAWLLGDIPAVKKAYPKAKSAVLSGYENDAVCGTWECLADAVHPGGSGKLKSLYREAGKAKSEWAEKIAPLMNVEENRSPSFCYFRGKLLELSGNAR